MLEHYSEYLNTKLRRFVEKTDKFMNLLIHYIGNFFLAGHGFKLAPVVGKILCELAMDKTPSYDLTPCRIDRFFNPKARM